MLSPGVRCGKIKGIVKRENVHYTRNSKVQVLLDIWRLFGVKLFSIYLIGERSWLDAHSLTQNFTYHLVKNTRTLIYFAMRFPDQYRLLLWVLTGYWDRCQNWTHEEAGWQTSFLATRDALLHAAWIRIYRVLCCKRNHPHGYLTHHPGLGRVSFEQREVERGISVGFSKRLGLRQVANKEWKRKSNWLEAEKKEREKGFWTRSPSKFPEFPLLALQWRPTIFHHFIKYDQVCTMFAMFCKSRCQDEEHQTMEKPF